MVYRIPLPKDARRPQATDAVLVLEPVLPTVRLTPPLRAVGRTFEFPFPLPEPSNAGGRPPTRTKPAGKPPRKSSTSKPPRKANPKAQQTKPRPEPATT